MKIAIITNTLYEEIVPLAKYLAKTVEVDFYTIVSKKGSGLQLFYESDDLLVNEPCGVIESVEKKGYISNLFSDYISNCFCTRALLFPDLAFMRFENIKLARRTAKFLNREKYDTIHFNGTSLLFYLLKLFCWKTPFVLTTHDPTPHTGENTLNFKIHQFLLKHQKSIQHIVHSFSMSKMFRAKYPQISSKNIHVIYYGLHDWLKKYKFESKHNKDQIIFFGRISQYKGIEYLVEAAKVIRKKIPNLNVIIAGNGEYYFDISAIRNDSTFKVINRYIPNEELVQLLNESEIVVCPYTDATQSGVVMTAFTLNKPVVATRVGGLPEMIKDGKTGVLVCPKDSLDLANAIVDLLTDGKKIQILRDNIKQFYKNGCFSWKTIAEQTIHVYEKAIAI